MTSWALFWCLSAKKQAALMQGQWDAYGTKLEIPAPPMTSKGVWLAVETENLEEIDRLMRQKPKSPRQVT